MPLPAGVELVTVSSAGQPLTLPDGTRIQGSFTFTGPDLVTIGAHDVVLGGGVTVPLVDGEFSVQLVATDATGMDPTGWTYRVVANFGNAPNWTRYISLPKSSPSVDLADVLVPDPVAGSYGALVDPSTLLAKSANLSDLTNPGTARANLGLGTAAVANIDTTSGDIAPLGTQAAGSTGKAADAGHVHTMPRLDQVGPPTTVVSMNNQKLTSLANGVAASDAAAVGQLPAPATTGAQGTVQLSGDLAGTATSPQVTGTHLAAPLPIGQGGTGAATASAALAALNGTPVSTVRSITSATVTAAPWDVLECDATAQPIIVTLPANTAGVRVTVKKTDSSANTVTISGTVDGTINPALSYQYGSMELVADGTKWVRVVRPSLGALVDYPATTDARYVRQSQVGAASGVASLDSTGAVPLGQIPVGAYAPRLRLPRYVQPSQVITTFQSGHGWSNNAGSTFVANDTADYISGSQAAKLFTGGTGAAANLSKIGMTSFDATGKIARLRLKIDDITHMAGLNFYLGNSGLTSNNYKWIIQGGMASSNFVTSGDWVTITLPWADATVTGTPSRSALTDARIQVTDDNTSNPVTLHAQSVELIPDGSQRIASFCFDDCWESLELGKAVMDTYGWPGNCYVITDILANPQPVIEPNTGSRLTVAELRMMQDRYGWRIGAHALRDADHSLTATGMIAAQLRDDMLGQKSWLDANGLRGASGFAWPLGQFGLTTDGFSTIDVIDDFYAYARTTFSKTLETFPPADPYRLRAISGISTFTGGVTPSSLTAAGTGRIDQVAANNGWLILVFHKIVTGTPAATTECALSDFQAICAKIASAGFTVMTVDDALENLG